MFNYTNAYAKSRNFKTLGGASLDDQDTHQTLYAGVDHEGPTRAIVRKLVQVNNNTYCYKEIRITPGEKTPQVHTQLLRIRDLDLHEKLTPEEIHIRGA